MKFYFPTSTLNFDAIYSSMSLMPPRYHCDEAIWFPRYFKTDVDLSDDVFVLYSSPICWEISDYDSENYPMLIEVGSSIVDRVLSDHAYTVQRSLTNGISCVIRNFPIVFKANDILSGCVKILFRTLEEKRTLLTRARIGVSESKLPVALESMDIDIACETFPKDVVNLDSIKTEVQSVINSSGLMFDQKDFEEFERKDRIDGAVAGFHAGKWLRSMRDGYCLDSFRNGLDYLAWKESLPNEFAAIIDMLCGMIGFRWDVNRDAIVDFCTKCWNTCFLSGENCETLRHRQWHEILRSIARSHRDVTFSYPVSSIQDGYMQAIACFMKSGKRYKILVDSIRDDHIKMPELALALHGALVGYSVLSRVLFEKRSYGDDEKKHEDVSRAEANRGAKESSVEAPKASSQSTMMDMKENPNNDVPRASGGELSSWAKQVWEKFKRIPSAKGTNRLLIENALHQALLDCKDEQELLRVLPEKYQSEGWGNGTKIYRGLKKSITEARDVDLFGHPAQSSSTDNLLIQDAVLLDVIAAEFVDIGEERVRLLKDAVRKFIAKYMPDGYYGQHPERYKQLNPDMIDHMMKCFSSQSTPDLNFRFKGAEEGRFVTFLEGRYHCKRRMH